MDIQFQHPKRKAITARLPKLNKSCSGKHQTMYDSSFAVQGPKLWNLLPAGITQITDLETFKICLYNEFLSKNLTDHQSEDILVQTPTS